MDAYGIDIGKTLEPLGFKVEFDTEGKLAARLVRDGFVGLRGRARPLKPYLNSILGAEMSLGVICCKVLEKEVRAVIQDHPAVSHLEVMEWGLHISPDILLQTLSERIRALEGRGSRRDAGLRPLPGPGQASGRFPGSRFLP